MRTKSVLKDTKPLGKVPVRHVISVAVEFAEDAKMQVGLVRPLCIACPPCFCICLLGNVFWRVSSSFA